MKSYSKICSPFSKLKECSATQAINISGYPTGNGHKSPCNRDRFFGSYKSPKASQAAMENGKQELYDTSGNVLNNGTPGTPNKKYRRPQVTSQLLDAPDILTDLPEKLIDINQKDNSLAIALGSNVYIYHNSDVNILMEGNIPINGLCWIGDDLAISGNGHIEIWDVEQKQVYQSLRDHENRAVAMSSYENRFATGGADGLVYVYDLRDHNCQRMNAHRNSEVCALKWSLDGNTLASSGMDGVVNVIGKKKKRYTHKSSVLSLEWMNSGILITGENGPDGAVHAFHTRSDDPEKTIYTGYPVTGLSSTEQWGLLVSHSDSLGSWDIWAPDLSKKVADFQGHRAGILNMCANNDGGFVATISSDESLCIWDLKPSALTPVKSPRMSFSIPSPGYRNSLPITRTSPYQMSIQTVSEYPLVR